MHMITALSFVRAFRLLCYRMTKVPVEKSIGSYRNPLRSGFATEFGKTLLLLTFHCVNGSHCETNFQQPRLCVSSLNLGCNLPLEYIKIEECGS